ncbi:MAG: hypothetical protein MN733_19395 [Nitrososphaera sp.]|nr:hypothetical protein [Nitrososphaera sp.]
MVLSYAAELRIRVSELFSHDIRRLSNLPHHSLVPAQLNVLVHKLLQRDYLELLDPQSFKNISAHAYPDLTLAGANFIGLTTAGGQAWEEYAKPDWYLYLDIDEGDNDLLITSATEPLIFTALYFLLPGVVIPETSIIKIGNWSPVYWKTLDTGFQAKVTVSDTGAARIKHIIENPWPPEVDSLCLIWRARIEHGLRNLRLRK